jgi:hypothetical protein
MVSMGRLMTDSELASVLADVGTGDLVESPPDSDAAGRLADFAAALPELFASASLSRRALYGRLDDDATSGLQDIVLISPRRVHVAQRVRNEPGLALVSVAPRTESIGLILSEARARLTRT